MVSGAMSNARARVRSSSVNAPQVTEVYDKMKGFIKSTHWSKPYYSTLVHNNPQLPYHLLEHVNCTYLSTPGRAPTLLALKQHAQSLAVLISLLAPAQHEGTFEPPNIENINGDAPFAAGQAFDWLNNLQEHYHTDDSAHKKPLNALVNLIKSNSDTEGPKWHCPLETTGMESPEKHPPQQHRPYESHMTLLMHANEILERLDHEYLAMGGILGIIPLDCENVEEQRALSQAKTTLVGQWILHTQHLVARMHELEISYGNCLDLLANEAVVPMQHVSQHGPDAHSGREAVFSQDRWIMANAGEDVFTFIHRLLDQAEAHQDAQDDKFAEQKVLGDAAYSGEEDHKYRGIVKADLSTRFYRIRGSGHGPLFVLPAFGDRPNTRHTRDIENRPTVVVIPQPETKEPVSAWEARHKDLDEHMLKLTTDNKNLEARVSELQSSVALRDREIERLDEFQKQYDERISNEDKDLAKEVVYLNECIRHMQTLLKQGRDREGTLREAVQKFKDANISVQNDQNAITFPMTRMKDQQSKIRDLEKEIRERDRKVQDLAWDNETLRNLHNSPTNPNSPVAGSRQVKELQSLVASLQSEKQQLQQEVHNLKKSSALKGKILNLPEGINFDNGGTYEDTNLGVTACSSEHYKALLQAKKNDRQQKSGEANPGARKCQEELEKAKAECARLHIEIANLRKSSNKAAPAKFINIPFPLKYTSTFRDDEQGLIVLNTEWYDQLVVTEKLAEIRTREKASLERQIAKLKAPVEIDLNEATIDSLNNRLGQSQVYKDPERNIAIMALNHYDELLAANQNKTAMEKALKESKREAQNLKQHLLDVRKQLEKSMREHGNIGTDLPNLQIQRDDFEAQLAKAVSKCDSLEKQINEINTYRPPSVLESKVLKIQKQLTELKATAEHKDTRLKQLQGRCNALQLNENRLQTEAGELRAKLALHKAGIYSHPSNTRASSNDPEDSDELEAARADVEGHTAEIDALEAFWNNLHAIHQCQQAAFQEVEETHDYEKEYLQQRLMECEAIIHSFQTRNDPAPEDLEEIEDDNDADDDGDYDSEMEDVI
ncbi:hypothetical protein F5Y01DRAFT_97975 [Xylaria sp. FL0043]|nr:hypothetical protein F5Y01DRAFT_97975 [Xylaria sp. FL0043]